MLNIPSELFSLEKWKAVLSYNPFEPLIFNSGFFLFFFLVCLLFYQFLVGNKKARTFYLLCFSLFFYYKSSGIYLYLMIISAMIDFYAGRYITVSSSAIKRKLLLILSLTANLSILGYFKYTNFFIEQINTISGSQINALDLFLPVGISFFTFQSMSYTIDIYRNHLKPEEKFIDFLFYVSFFPQLVAGPIVRAADFLPQIPSEKKLIRQDIGKAFYLIILGLIKKAIIADYISVNFVDRIFELPARYTGLENLFAVYGYALQIFCDFSGYSDMAIGLAMLMGFRLTDNFNAPYKAASITEFWRRWHISLSTWLRDYLYISLGGNRCSKIKRYFNLMVTMLLGGLWHGASWKFVFWGGIHGLFLVIEKYFNIPEKIAGNKMLRLAGIIITFHLVSFCWIFFRAESFSTAIEVLDQIFNYFHPEVLSQFAEGYTTVLILMVIGLFFHFTPEKIENKISTLFSKVNLFTLSLILTIVIWLVIQFKSADIQPFIYFQF
ncbi:MAG: MBOAT family protein [Ignavibacteria bacterium]|nr:MBOAT family protein [Ignavibacteria bacterium]